MNKLKTSSTFILCIMFLPLYIIFYKNSSPLFWLLFIIERGISIFLEEKLVDSLDKLDDDPNLGKFLCLLLIFVLIAVGILIYILFNYSKLFFIIIIGEAIDKVLIKLLKKENR